MPKKIAAIILAGGKGTRFSKKTPKQFFKINKKTLLEINIEKFQKNKDVDEIIIISEKSSIFKTKKIAAQYSINVVKGGASRQLSVYEGLKVLKKKKPGYVLIHDSARPFFSDELLKKLIKSVDYNNCIIPVVKVTDSLIKLSPNRQESNQVDRDRHYLVQTPQIFPFTKIYKAHENTKKSSYTDDSALARENNLNIKIIEGSKNNIKITNKDDLTLLNMIENTKKTQNSVTRVGTGFDVHEFEKGDWLILCGIKIPFSKKLKGHSDADVGFHTIVDAILGSLGQGDIGDHFPPSQKKWKNVSSEKFMNFAKELLKKNKAIIQNIDLTLICEKPKLFKYKVLMKENIAKTLKISKSLVNVKATTTEKLGFTGREEGIAAQAVVSIRLLNA